MSDITITPLTTTVGARIDGIDLAQPLDAVATRTIKAALATHSVLAFSGQNIDLDQQRDLQPDLRRARTGPVAHRTGWGPTTPRPSWTTACGGPHAARGSCPTPSNWNDEFQGWHVDSSYCRSQIPSVSTLRALRCCRQVGGGTGSWASMACAYEALSPAMQAWLETLNAVHAPPPGQREVLDVASLPQAEQDHWDRELGARTHPLVVVHPVTGRKGLFVNPTYVVKIDTLSNAESAMMLRFLYRHLHPAGLFIYRHRWEEGDILVWDQLATIHLAPNDYLPHERRVVRVTAGLTTPTGVSAQAAPALVRKKVSARASA